MWPIHAWQEVGQMFCPTWLVEGGLHQLIREALLPLGKIMRVERRESHTRAPPPPPPASPRHASPRLASSRHAGCGMRESRRAELLFATHDWYMNGCTEYEQSVLIAARSFPLPTAPAPVRLPARAYKREVAPLLRTHGTHPSLSPEH